MWKRAIRGIWIALGMTETFLSVLSFLARVACNPDCLGKNITKNSTKITESSLLYFLQLTFIISVEIFLVFLFMQYAENLFLEDGFIALK